MIGTPGGTPDRPALFFSGPAEFRAWLEQHHDTETELWMGLYKRHVSPRGLTWKEAVEEALCFGWIDSVVQPIDEDCARQRWTPRRRGSTWSRVNIDLVARLVAEDRMQPSGLAAFERRLEERSAVYSFEQVEAGDLGPYEAALRADPGASAFWDAATPSYRRQCTHWVLAAKREQTRQRRLAQLVQACARGELPPAQRFGEQPRWVARAAQAARTAGGQPAQEGAVPGGDEPGEGT